MKLEVGMYIRTNKVGIKKIYKIDNNKTKYKYLYKLKNQDGDGCIDLSVLCEDDVVKFSYNIIDLIEVGDYVNGKKIVDVGCLTNGPRKGTKVIDYYITPSAVCYLENEDIKSVITHEQIERMVYKVGE